MKSFVSFALVICFAVSGYGMSVKDPKHSKPVSPVLHNSASWNNLMVVAKHAQKQDMNHTSRLIPPMSEERLKEKESCCVHANILDYFMRFVLTIEGKHRHSRFPQVKEDLGRVKRDLENHAGCDPVKYDEHEYSQKFKMNYLAAGVGAPVKAVGEMDILFHYLYESCN